MVYNREFSLQSSAFDSIYDITDDVVSIAKESAILNGLVNVFVIGSTASITTIEYENGLKKDLPEFLNKLIPRGAHYKHNLTWNDGNGDAHLKASLIGPDLTCPIRNGEIVLGTWQQIIVIDSDNKPRVRKIVVTVYGE